MVGAKHPTARGVRTRAGQSVQWFSGCEHEKSNLSPTRHDAGGDVRDLVRDARPNTTSGVDELERVRAHTQRDPVGRCLRRARAARLSRHEHGDPLRRVQARVGSLRARAAPTRARPLCPEASSARARPHNLPRVVRSLRAKHRARPQKNPGSRAVKVLVSWKPEPMLPRNLGVPRGGARAPDVRAAPRRNPRAPSSQPLQSSQSASPREGSARQAPLISRPGLRDARNQRSVRRVWTTRARRANPR